MKGYYGAGSVTMGVEKDLAVVAEQEQVLQFDGFNAEMAWGLGSSLRAEAVRLGAAMTFEIQVAGRVLFTCATEGAAAGQADWIRRKRNSVLRFGRSSYALGLELAQAGKTLTEKHGLPETEFAMHGGAFPIVLRGTGLVGTVIASGLPQREDHAMVVAAVAELLGVEVVRLD